MSVPRSISLFLAVLLAAGCSSPTAVERLLERTDDAEARWLAVRPVSYEVVEWRVCECLPSEAGPVRLSVTRRQGATVPSETEVLQAGVYVEDEEDVPPELLERFVTVQELFGIIREAARGGAASVQAVYHPELGYPTEVDIDYDPLTADDETGWRLEVAEPLG